MSNTTVKNDDGTCRRSRHWLGEYHTKHSQERPSSSWRRRCRYHPHEAACDMTAWRGSGCAAYDHFYASGRSSASIRGGVASGNNGRFGAASCTTDTYAPPPNTCRAQRRRHVLIPLHPRHVPETAGTTSSASARAAACAILICSTGVVQRHPPLHVLDQFARTPSPRRPSCEQLAVAARAARALPPPTRPRSSPSPGR